MRRDLLIVGCGRAAQPACACASCSDGELDLVHRRIPYPLALAVRAGNKGLLRWVDPCRTGKPMRRKLLRIFSAATAGIAAAIALTGIVHGTASAQLRETVVGSFETPGECQTAASDRNYQRAQRDRAERADRPQTAPGANLVYTYYCKGSTLWLKEDVAR